MPQSNVTRTTYTFATAEDGTPLTGTSYEPDYAAFPAPREVILMIHGGGFTENDDGSSPQQVQMAVDLASRGIIAFAPNYRLVRETGSDPGIPGQVGQGFVPTQYNDCKRAALHVLNPQLGTPLHGKVVGTRYGCAGGSAGGCHGTFLAADTTTQSSPVPWDTTKRPFFMVDFSGAHKFDDVESQQSGNGSGFLQKCYNYCGLNSDMTQIPPLPLSPSDQAVMLADSPYAKVTAAMPPYLTYNGTNEPMPLPQLTTMQSLMEDTLGLTNCEFVIDSGQFTNPGDHKTSDRVHSWSRYNYAPVEQHVNDWIDAQIAGDASPPPPSGLPRGCWSLTSGRDSVPADVLADPNVDGVSIVEFWEKLETAAGVFDYTYLDAQIKACAAANKKVLIRILTQGGSETAQGHTPDWLWDLVSTDRKTIYLGATVSSSSPNISLVANSRADTFGQGKFYEIDNKFTPADVGKSITGTAIPANTTIVSVAGNGLSAVMSHNALTNVNPTVFVLPDRGDIDKVLPYSAPGYTYTWSKQGNFETFIVYWNPTYRRYKNRMYQALGDHLTNGSTLTPTEKSFVVIQAVSSCNASSEDWNVPHEETVQGNEALTEVDEWLNDVDDPLYGSGYWTEFLIDISISQETGTGDEIFVDGVVTSSGTRLASRTADFHPGDDGLTVSNFPGQIGYTATISYVSPTQVGLSPAYPGGTSTRTNFTINSRRSGVIDRAMVAFPNQYITMAIEGMGADLDRFLASQDTRPENKGSDVKNYVPRRIMNKARLQYTSRIFAQCNGLNATSPPYSRAVTGTSQFSHLAQIHDQGGQIAMQDLWYCFMDPTFRMNGGTNIDQDTGQPLTDLQILEKATSVAATYGILYQEIYDRDISNLPDGAKFAHDLLNPDGGGGGGGGGGTVVPPFQLTYDFSNYRDEVQAAVADLLNVSIKRQGIQAERAAKWARLLSKHARYAWQLIAWPQFNIVEPRAFAPFWLDTDQYDIGDRVFYVPGSLYYDVIQSLPPIGTLPTDDQWFAPTDTTTIQFFIPILQRCRRRIGQLVGAFPSDPRLNTGTPVQLPAVLSQRGIEIANFGTASTSAPVWLSYQAVPYRWGSDLWNSQTQYNTGALVLFDGDGEVYRSVTGNAANPPGDDTGRWSHVPFPTILVNYCTYMAASDDVDDRQQAQEWRSMALEYLAREMDDVGLQTPTSLYDFGSRNSFALPIEGLSDFTWSVFAPFTGNTTDLTQQISTVCVNEWGDMIPQ